MHVLLDVRQITRSLENGTWECNGIHIISLTWIIIIIIIIILENL